MDLIYLGLALVLVGLNGFFVASEFALVKIRPTRIDELITEGKPGAAAVGKMLGQLNAYLSATQLGITFASMGLGLLGEPAFHRLLVGTLHYLHVPSQWHHQVAMALTFIIISFLHIVVGELAPKSLAILRPEAVVIAAAVPMRIFYTLFFPFIWLLNGISDLLLRRLGITSNGHDNSQSHSPAEIKLILAQSRSAGHLSSERANLVDKALTLRNRTASSLMVPRNDVVYLSPTLSIDENISRATQSRHSRFPFFERELDEIKGVIDIRDLLLHRINYPNQDIDLATFANDIPYFPESMTGERLLYEFRQRRVPMAVIVDEYGAASGIVTTADIVTAVMGEMSDEEGEMIVQLSSGALDMVGTASLENLEELLGCNIKSNEMRTVGGFLTEHLGRIPKRGDRVYFNGYCFHVLNVTGPKINKVRVQLESLTPRRMPSEG